MKYLSKEEVARLVKSGSMAFPLGDGGHARAPIGKSGVRRVPIVNQQGDKVGEMKVEPVDPVDPPHLEQIINSKLDDVAATIEADRDQNVAQFAEGSPITPGLVAGFNRAAEIVRAAKL